MVAIKSKAYITVLLHVLVWMLFAFVLLFYQPLSWNITLPYQFWIKQGWVLLILITIFYLNSYIYVPGLLLKNKNALFALAITASCLSAGILVEIIDDLLQLPRLMDIIFKELGFTRPPKRFVGLDIFLYMMTLFIAGISTSVTLIQKWQTDKQLRDALEKEKIASELSFLKAQINPHFFFNTLNNIYALTHVDVAKSRKALHMLSRMMRYLLYDTQTGITPLSKEVSFIRDYLALMQLRLNESTTVSFLGPDPDADVNIAPMLFLPYIENAFKHGISTISPSQITINLSLEANQIALTVTNTICTENTELADNYGGIGLLNTKRRLDLLYPGKHTFCAEKTEDGKEFIVHLTLVPDDFELYSS
ncbi:sensor histidine kinase [Pedobacter antarcticus]|uniref:sensor histidine kinase n=1 Tax=Pedobacter antarcticus TaxID=34086 RepID=UPI001C59D9A6|nr:histidine kinase [Pedobacter antarcticus]